MRQQQNSVGWAARGLHLDRHERKARLTQMKGTLTLSEMTVPEKLGIMEEIWADLSRVAGDYTPPEWHGRVLEERVRLAESGDVGFTDWEEAKKEIRGRVS